MRTLKSKKPFTSALVVIMALLTLVMSSAPLQAYAESNTVFTATATSCYAHPGTGVIEDAGGAGSMALGQSMTESATYPAALVQYDGANNPYVTLRLNLMDQITDVSMSVDRDWNNNYAGVGYNYTPPSSTTGDFLVQADPSSVFRIQMYVGPMGCYVTFYVTLSDYIEGNAYGFDQFVEASGTTQNDTDNSNLTRSEDVEAPEGTDPVAAPAAAALLLHLPQLRMRPPLNVLCHQLQLLLPQQLLILRLVQVDLNPRH